jgi:hypothetical protein
MSALLEKSALRRALDELRAQLADSTSLRALTLWQPWAWAILHAGKTVENRGWALARWAQNRWIALHAGGPHSTEPDDAGWIRTTFGLQVPPDTGRGLVGLVKFGTPYHVKRPPSPYAAGDGDGPFYRAERDTPPSRVDGGARQPATPWEIGPVCWPITERLALPTPITLRGAQGFWFVPPHTTEQILAQLAGAAAAEARP